MWIQEMCASFNFANAFQITTFKKLKKTLKNPHNMVIYDGKI